MQSQPSSELSVEDIEKAMLEIERQPAPAAAAVPAPAPVAAAAPVNPIKTFIDANQLRQDVNIEPDKLDQAFREQASLFVHYANLKSQARMQYEKMKAAFEILESRLYAIEHQRLTAEAVAAAEEAAKDEAGKKKSPTVKGPTVDQINAAVKANPKWWAGKNRLIEAQGIYDLATNTASAFEQRRDMLIQMGSDRREEMKGQARLTEVARENMASGMRTAATR